MTAAETYQKYPHVHPSYVDALIAAGLENPQFDVLEWLETAERNAIKKLDLLARHEAAINRKFGASTGDFRREGRDRQSYSYAGYLLIFSLDLVDTQEDFDKVLVYVEELAAQLLRGEPAAVAVAEAYENEHRALERVKQLERQLSQSSIIVPNLDIVYRQAIKAFKVAQVLSRVMMVDWLEAVVPLMPQSAQVRPEAAGTLLYPIFTSQESDILFRGASDGKRGDNWSRVVGRETQLWQSSGATHRLERLVPLQKNSSSPDGSVPNGSVPDWEASERLIQSQNVDFALAFNYIVGVLCPPKTSGEQRNLIGAWIDLNDVMGKIGWLNQKPNAAKKEQLRAQLWEFLRFGAETKVTGQRSSEYHDPTTRKVIETRIESAPWQITDEIYPVPSKSASSNLNEQTKPAPLLVYMVISQQWQPLFENPRLAQFYPCGELLGQIPPNQPTGDWARIIGLNLARLWRIYPRETLSGSFSPTRRELLTHFTPKTKTVEELLESNDPKRAVKCYRDALSILVEIGLIAAKGDAAKGVTPTAMLESYGRKGWQKAWMDGRCNLFPGKELLPAVRERVGALPVDKPRNLKASKGR